MRCTVLVATVTSVLALAVASAVNLPKKLIYNASESAPVGFYWVDEGAISRDDHVYAHVPERVRKFVVERGYLPPDVPLVKRVVGLNGDRICRVGNEIFLNGAAVATAKERDGLGRQMPRWHGCHILSEQLVFLLQDHPQSFDSRYFGPVDRRLIIGRATPLRLPWRKRGPS